MSIIITFLNFIFHFIFVYYILFCFSASFFIHIEIFYIKMLKATNIYIFANLNIRRQIYYERRNIEGPYGPYVLRTAVKG